MSAIPPEGFTGTGFYGYVASTEQIADQYVRVTTKYDFYVEGVKGQEDTVVIPIDIDHMTFQSLGVGGLEAVLLTNSQALTRAFMEFIALKNNGLNVLVTQAGDLVSAVGTP